jgi:hypothetical protein
VKDTLCFLRDNSQEYDMPVVVGSIDNNNVQDDVL